MRHRGFTIVELIIVISIMAILLVLSVANLLGSEANARDAKRKIDIATIAQHLETYYTSGTDSSTAIGTYPSTALTTSVPSSVTKMLRDIDLKSITAPNMTDPVTPTQTFISATNNIQTTAGVLPQPTISQYVYQPLHSDGSLCNDTAECRKFNLYYRLETDNNVYTITSRSQ